MGRRFLRSVLISDLAAFVVAIITSTYLIYGTPLPWEIELYGSSTIWPMILMLSVGGVIGVGFSIASWRAVAPRPLYSRAFAFVGFSVIFTTVGLVLTRVYFSRPYLLTFAMIWLLITLTHRYVRRRRPWQEELLIVTREDGLVDDLRGTPHVFVLKVLDPLGESPGVPVGEGVTLVVDIRAVLSESMAQYVSSASISGTRVRTLTTVYEAHTGRIPIVHLAEGWELSEPVKRATYAPIKRVLDVLVVAGTSLIWLPLMLIISLVVLLDVGRPVFYAQVRVGREKREFTLTKFRTMVRDAESLGPQFTERNDPRVTPSGRFLRKYRLDEVPQLLSVLRGDLSLIGPRPERPVFVDGYRSEIPFYDARHLIRPGVTGWAQVNHGYAGNHVETIGKLTYDLFYIKNSSFWLDTQIIGKSIWTVLTGYGAR